MTKKDYEFLADRLNHQWTIYRKYNPEDDSTEEAIRTQRWQNGFSAAVRCLIDTLAMDNPRFDEDLFKDRIYNR
jgi:hypothetical protein